jgi:hypothetical protein
MALEMIGPTPGTVIWFAELAASRLSVTWPPFRTGRNDGRDVISVAGWDAKNGKNEALEDRAHATHYAG